MIIVRIELLSAITGKTTELGRMNICNDGTSTDAKRGNYEAAVLHKTTGQPLRMSRVENYPRLSYNVWRLVLRALRRAFPEEN